MTAWVNILASRKNGALYVGVTNHLARRIHEHRTGALPGHAKRYGVARLVWYREFADIEEAIAQEKRLKRWRREWKNKLIEEDNPDWRDLAEDLNA